MLRQRCLESGCNGMREFGNAESHGRSKDKNRSVAGRMHEGWLHQRKPEDIPQPGQGNSFGRAVRSVESAVQENGEREEDRSLIKSGNPKTKSRRGNSTRFFLPQSD